MRSFMVLCKQIWCYDVEADCIKEAVALIESGSVQGTCMDIYDFEVKENRSGDKGGEDGKNDRGSH